MRSHIAFPLLFALSLFAAGCGKPKPGDKCSDVKKGACKNDKTAIMCVDGTYAEVVCGGATGCMAMGLPMGASEISCTPGGDEGDTCLEDKSFACSSDNKKMLKCKKHKWVVEMECNSAKGCISNAEGVSCENAEAEEGDKCKQENTFACSPDKKKLLGCNGKKMIVASTCRGQNHCQIQGSKLKCDTSMAEIDDPCDEEGKLSCDTAKKVMLECDGKKFVKKQECKKRCNNAFDKYSCD